MTHVDDAPVCTTAQVSDAITEDKKQRGGIQIKFALKPELTVDKPRRAFDEHNLLIPPSVTKKPKLNPVDTDLLQPDDNGTSRHQIGTTICKCFNDVECEGERVHFHHNDQLCQI